MVLSIAVVSDLHVHSEDPSPDAPSHLGIADPEDQPKKHPIAGLKKLIADEGLRSNLLLNAGDSTNKADPASLKYAWQKMQELKSALKADHVIATAGNHDLDSRFECNDFDAKGHVQSLVPSFPGLDESRCDRFWSRNFVVFEEEACRVLLLNTAAYHGGGRDQKAEMQHGRVSRNTINAIEQELNKTDIKPVNILLCHHHLTRDTAVAEKDYSEMYGGDLLLDLLGSGRYGQWMVIHGHKHHPKLSYAGGSATSSPIIFGAASLSAKLYPALAALARNQFHILRFPVADFDSLGVDLAGTVMSWDWIPLRGWQRAGQGSGLPHKAGFGYRSSLGKDIKQIEETLKAKGAYVEWEAILSALPQLKYLLPEDERTLLSKLQSRGIDFARDDDGSIKQLSLK